MLSPIRQFTAALGFLTIIPVPGKWSGEEDDPGRGLPYFIIVGLIIGLSLAGLDVLLNMILPIFPASAAVVVAMIAVSGGLHIDGLADTADGFFSSKPRERVLEIMRDSRIGSMGVAAIVSVFTMKVAALAALSGHARFGAILLMPVAGRFALVFMIAAMKYVRGNEGLGTAFSKNRSWAVAIISFCILALAGWPVVGIVTIPVAASTLAGVALFSLYINKGLGGYTGDTLGAGCELMELVPVIAVLICERLAGKLL